MIFRNLALEVMTQRDRDGIRGIDREHSRMRCHILTAAFADTNVTQISRRDIREWHRAMAQKDALGPGKPRKLSRQTRSRCASLVSVVFDEAVERELIETNPCADAAPKKVVDETDTEQKWSYLTWDEQQRLFACDAIPVADRLMIRIAIATGMRQAEQRHIELPDFIVDGDDPHVLIRFAGRRKGKKLPPKSGKIRKVPLFGDGLVAAREWLALLPSYAPSNPENLVFPSSTGKLRQQGKPLGHSQTLKKHYVAAGIPLRKGLHWHALRHTFATNLVSGVIPGDWRLHIVQKLMGHSSVTITERYAHVGEDAVKLAVKEAVAAAARVEAARIEADRSVTVPPEAMPEPRVVAPPMGFLARAVGRVKEVFRGVA